MKIIVSKQAHRLYEQIKESPDKALTLSQARLRQNAVRELLETQPPLLILGMIHDGVEAYKVLNMAREVGYDEA